MYSRKKIIKKTRRKKLFEKSRFLAWRSIIFIMLFLVLIGILAWQSGNKKALIDKIEVLGNEVVNQKDILRIVQSELAGKYAWLFHKDNIFIYPQNNIKEKLLVLDKRIRDVNVYRDSLTAIAVEISERKPAYMWCELVKERPDLESAEGAGGSPASGSNQKKCFFLDKTGYIFAEAPQFSGSVFFTFYGYRKYADAPLGNFLFEERDFERLIAFKEKIKKLGFEPAGLVEKEEGDFDLILEDESKIMFNQKQNLADVLENFDSSIDTIKAGKKDLEYIDLRFGNKVFYKFKD